MWHKIPKSLSNSCSLFTRTFPLSYSLSKDWPPFFCLKHQISNRTEEEQLKNSNWGLESSGPQLIVLLKTGVKKKKRQNCNSLSLFRPPFCLPCRPQPGRFLREFTQLPSAPQLRGQTVGSLWVQWSGFRWPRAQTEPDPWSPEHKLCPAWPSSTGEQGQLWLYIDASWYNIQWQVGSTALWEHANAGPESGFDMKPETRIEKKEVFVKSQSASQPTL